RCDLCICWRNGNPLSTASTICHAQQFLRFACISARFIYYRSFDVKTALRLNRDAERGVALVIVLAFLLLMAGLVVAFLSRTATHRQVAHGSFNEAKADELAWGALDIVVADLKQEISDGSTATTVNNITIYSPNAGD